ncbi:hypothetical protein GBAR_LOCUS19961 [Geodia barretti]|uniref:Uncharacterized protein n=1 Tax=Geodia barretti TaxID=519541 RepID=A0AA35X2N2_GEOBA|nr:hypothetical protein GBAR_LOCUS19961 [Geodia barretti]
MSTPDYRPPRKSAVLEDNGVPNEIVKSPTQLQPAAPPPSVNGGRRPMPKPRNPKPLSPMGAAPTPHLWSQGLLCKTPPCQLRRRINYAETGKLYLRTLLDPILHRQHGPRHHFTMTSSQAARRRHRIKSGLALSPILSNGVAWELKTIRKGVPPISECVCKAATCSAPRGEVLLR